MKSPPCGGLFPSLRSWLTEIGLSDLAKNAGNIPYARCSPHSSTTASARSARRRCSAKRASGSTAPTAASCRELLARIVAGSPLGAATSAELLAVLQAMSLAAPLERAATVLYWDRFAETFPADAARLRSEIGAVAADSYDQVRAKELETKLRRQLARDRAAESG